MNLKPTMSLVTIFVLSNLILFGGCASNNHKENIKNSSNHIYKGIVREVDTTKFSNSWNLVIFEGGLEAQIRAPDSAEFYMGHYQEIAVDSNGEFLSNECKSYDDLISGFKERVYETAPPVPSLAVTDE